MGCFVYAVLGSSKDISIGPVAIMSLLVSSFALSPVPGNATYAIIVSLVGGAIQVLIGLLNIGESMRIFHSIRQKERRIGKAGREKGEAGRAE